MSAESERLLDKATHAIRSAEILLEAGEVDFAAGRAYYAMFYVASAVLLKHGQRYRKHSAVHAAFGEHFSKTGVSDPKFHRFLLDAFDRRIVSDYDTTGSVSPHEARLTIDQAKEFLSEAIRLLKQND